MGLLEEDGYGAEGLLQGVVQGSQAGAAHLEPPHRRLRGTIRRALLKAFCDFLYPYCYEKEPNNDDSSNLKALIVYRINMYLK